MNSRFQMNFLIKMHEFYFVRIEYEDNANTVTGMLEAPFIRS